MNPRLGQALAAIGAALIVAGVIGLVVDGDDDGGVAAPATTTTTEGAVVDDLPDPTEDLIEAFYIEFAAAFGDGDVEFLVDRLDPHVLELYGADQCRTHVERILGARSFDVLSVGDPAPWDFGTEREGTPLVVEDAIAVEVVQRLDGREATSEAHVTVRDAVVHWFTDCGDPV